MNKLFSSFTILFLLIITIGTLSGCTITHENTPTPRGTTISVDSGVGIGYGVFGGGMGSISGGGIGF